MGVVHPPTFHSGLVLDVHVADPETGGLVRTAGSIV